MDFHRILLILTLQLLCVSSLAFCVEPASSILDPTSNPALLPLLQEASNAASSDESQTASPIYMFSTSSSYFGNGPISRANSTGICATERSANFASLNCSNDLAFLVFSVSDDLASMPTNHGVPSNEEVLSAATSTQIAVNWADLFDFSINSSMQAAGVATGDYWTGSAADGTDQVQSCSGWALNTGNGTRGSFTANNQLYLNAGGDNCGTNDYPFLCICW